MTLCQPIALYVSQMPIYSKMALVNAHLHIIGIQILAKNAILDVKIVPDPQSQVAFLVLKTQIFYLIVLANAYLITSGMVLHAFFVTQHVLHVITQQILAVSNVQ